MKSALHQKMTRGKLSIHSPNLKIQSEEIRSSVIRKWQQIISSGNYIHGSNIKNFEKDFAQYCHVKHCVLVASGTDALYLAQKVLGIDEKDEVIMPSFTFLATALSTIRCGATPVFVDIDPKTFNIDVTKIEKNITKKTKAILPVDLYGQMANIPEIAKIAKKYNLKTIEDACQAHGANINNIGPAQITSVAAFSFYPTKNLPSFSDCGAIVTNSSDIAKKVRKIANYGYFKKYIADEIGINSRSDEFQAAWLNLGLKKLNHWNNKRRILANRYLISLRDLPIVLPNPKQGSAHVFHQFVIRTPQRNLLQKYLEKRNVQTTIHYPVPVHLQPAFKKFNNKRLFETERISKEVLSLPIYPHLTFKDQDYIISKIRSFFNK